MVRVVSSVGRIFRVIFGFQANRYTDGIGKSRKAVSRRGVGVLLADPPVAPRDRPARGSDAAAVRQRVGRIAPLCRRRAFRMRICAGRPGAAALRGAGRCLRALACPFPRAERHRPDRADRPPRPAACARHCPPQGFEPDHRAADQGAGKADARAGAAARAGRPSGGRQRRIRSPPLPAHQNCPAALPKAPGAGCAR